MAKIPFGHFMPGAALMYFADPNCGRRRPAVTRDRFVAGWREHTYARR